VSRRRKFMNNDKIINYLGIKMKLSTYKILQVCAVVLLTGGAVLSYIYLRSNSIWLFRNLWWICAAGCVAEIIEAATVIKKSAKQE
jgi:hypothetical protein